MRDAAQEDGAAEIALGVDDQVELPLEDRMPRGEGGARISRDGEIGNELGDATADQRRKALAQVEFAAGSRHPADPRLGKALRQRQEQRQFQHILAERIVGVAGDVDEDGFGVQRAIPVMMSSIMTLRLSIDL